MNDPERRFFVDGGVPLAEKIWRFINHIDRDQTFPITSHFAARVKSIADVDELWGNKSLYVPIAKIMGPSPIPDEKINILARDFLMSRIGSGAPIITSYNFGIHEDGKIVRIAFVSPVVKNMKPDGPDFSDLSVSFLEVFTNLRIEEYRELREETAAEYAAGCLDKFSKECVIFDIARQLYRNASELKKDIRVDVADKLCRYVHEQ